MVANSLKRSWSVTNKKGKGGLFLIIAKLKAEESVRSIGKLFLLN